MKPHQGLAWAATCQLWRQNFSASAAVRLLHLCQLLLPISPLPGHGQLVIILVDVICTLSHTQVSRGLPATSLFLNLLTSSVFLGGGVSWDFLLSGHLVFRKATGRSFPGWSVKSKVWIPPRLIRLRWMPCYSQKGV